MNDSATKSDFLFDHIPKTGGTSMRAVFDHIFGPDQVSPHVYGRSEAWALHRFSEYKVIAGHFVPQSPPNENEFPHGRARITILRHPIDRAVSEYYYVRHDFPWLNRLASTSAKSQNLLEFLKIREEDRDPEVSNFMTKHFAAMLSGAATDDGHLLALAKQALAQFDIVGLYEQFVDTVDLFCCQFFLPPVAEIPRVNVTSSRVAAGELDKPTGDKLTELNRLDIQLYEFAQTLFQNKKRGIFHQFIRQNQSNVTSPLSTNGRAAASAPQPPLLVGEAFGDREVEICETRILGKLSGTNVITSGEETTICVRIISHTDLPDLTIGIQISAADGKIAYGVNTYLLDANRPVASGGVYEITFSFPANFYMDQYFVTAAAHTGETHLDRCFHWVDYIAAFEIVGDRYVQPVRHPSLETKIEWLERAETIK